MKILLKKAVKRLIVAAKGHMRHRLAAVLKKHVVHVRLESSGKEDRGDVLLDEALVVDLKGIVASLG